MDLKQRDKFHFYARAAFFAHANELSNKKSIDSMVDEFIKDQKIQLLEYDLPTLNQKKIKSLSKGQKKELQKKWKKQVQEINQMWLKQMCQSEYGLIEKMTLFWHGHFACRTVKNPYQSLDLNNRIRKNALGDFKELLLSVSKSSAMINYLHLKQNRKGKPNEDFARELCELFTLGRDVDYTEKDVSEIARAFTGWTVDFEGNHLVNERQHDTGMKTIFGKTGNFGGEDVLGMILENKNTAVFIAKKVYRFFVRERIVQAEVDELGEVFFDSGYNIDTLMRHLFKAEWFYKAQGEIIKSPIELMVGLARMFDLDFADASSLLRVQRYLGQVLFDPPNVAGWAGGRSWIDSSRLAFRLRLGSLILNKGVVEDVLSPELDEMLSKKQRNKQLKLSEDIDWDAFFKKNKGSELLNVLIRVDNRSLQNLMTESDMEAVIQLVSIPDFQLT